MKINTVIESTISGAFALSGIKAMLITLKLWITTRKLDMSISIEELNKLDFSDVTETGAEAIPPTLPGDILLHDFMQPLKLSANALAKALHVPANRITSIVKGQRGITADTALRLGRYFGTTPQFWTNLQAGYDLQVALKESGEKISNEIIPLAS